MANIVEIILKATDKTSGVFKDAEKSVGKFESGLTKMVAKLGVAAMAGAALKKGLDFAVESTILAARVDTLGAVTEIMGKNAGISALEIDKLEKSIQAQGITTQASRQALAQMMQAEIDLSKATDLARLSQDAAVVGNMNSSEAFERLTQVIGTGNTVMARTMGLLVDFEGAYKTLASSLGKPVTELTELEKVQARTNEVMAQGRTIAGAYEAAMETGGKKLSSYARHLEELKLAVGDTFVDAFSVGIDVVTEGTDTLTSFFKADKLLNDAVKDGNVSWAERLGIRLKIIATEKTAQDVVEELTEEEEKRNEVLEKANEIYQQAGTYEAYKDRLLDLAFAVQELNVELELLTETEWLVRKETEDADAAMLSFANSAGLVVEPVNKLIGGTERYNEASSKFAERAGAGAQALRNEAAAAEAAAGAMQTYFGLFDDPDPVTVADNLTGQLSDHLVDAATGAAAAGEDMQPWIDALTVYDPLAASALENSTILAGTLDALDTALTAKGITPEQYAAAMEAIALGIEAGVEPGAAMETQLAKLGLEIGKEDETLIGFHGSLEALVAGSPYTVEVKTVYTQSGSPSVSAPAPKYTPTQSSRSPLSGIGYASGVDFTVPAGYPNDSFGPIWVQSGEHVQVTPSGNTAAQPPGGENQFHFHINNNMDIYEVAQRVIEIIQ